MYKGASTFNLLLMPDQELVAICDMSNHNVKYNCEWKKEDSTPTVRQTLRKSDSNCGDDEHECIVHAVGEDSSVILPPSLRIE
jgi:hypothetical protein